MIPLRDDNPTRSTPVVNVALIALCVIVFLWELMLPEGEAERAVYLLGFIPAVFFGRADLAQRWVAPRAIDRHVDVHARRLAAPRSATCCISGSSATTSRTASAMSGTSLFYLLCGVVAALAQGARPT